MLRASLKKWTTLGELLELIESGSALKPHEVQSVGMSFYEVNNILPFEFTAATEFTSRADIKTLVKGDLVTGRVGSIGTFAVYREDQAAGFSDNVLRIRLSPANADRTDFLLYFLNSELAAGQIDKFRKGSLQGVINHTTLKTVVVPALGKIKERELVTTMEAARAARRTKLAEAAALLISLDRDLLDTLALTPPPPDARRVFAVCFGTVRESRFDPDYFHPERILTVRGMESVTGRLWCPPLREAVTFQRDQITEPGENYLSLAHVQSHTGELVAANEEAAGTCFTFQRDDVLFGRLRPYLNKVHRAERPGCCSPEFHVLRVRPGTVLLPEYLATILRSSLILAQTRHMMTGNTHPRLANDDVVNLIIPIPDLATQTTIATEVRRRREQARALRTEAESGWAESKRWFEGQLLGKT